MTLKTHRWAFSAIELLVVVSVIVLLLALLFPAVQWVRESSRNTACKVKLKEIGLAFQNFEGVNSKFPTNGWGYRWHGDPNYGIGKQQPGGWTYQILRYVDQHNLADVGSGLPDLDRRLALTEVSNSALETFYCPSRRAVSPYPYTVTWLLTPNCQFGATAGRTDYAINGGDQMIHGASGPQNFADAQSYSWINFNAANGMGFVRLEVRNRDVLDGCSNTILVGEKCLSSEAYDNGSSLGDDQSLFMGDDADNRRWTDRLPIADRAKTDDIQAFGSAHPGVCNFSIVDGSTRGISMSIDLDVFMALGNRKDGKKVRMEGF